MIPASEYQQAVNSIEDVVSLPTVATIGIGATTGPTSYPWYTSTTYWGWGSTTSNPWYWTTTTNWYNNPTTEYPWWWSTTTTNWNNPTNYPWYTTTTPDYWGTTTRNPNNMCPYGAISSMSKQQCFQLFFKSLTFIEAEMDCQSRNGHLASIHNAFDNMLLNDYARNMIGPNTQYYIGANDLTNKQWAWTDGTEFDFVDWYTYQSGNDYADCAVVDTSHGAWIKSDCYSGAFYACTVPTYPY
uniref:C-type lectin domain-containing protein n=1 Tax=Panagrolaimus superbus TaxID=310955 RepID=A0A914XXI6_9BILA